MSRSRQEPRTLSFNLQTRSKHDALVQSFVARCSGGVVCSRRDCESLLQQAHAARRQDGQRLAKMARLSRGGRSVKEGGLIRAHKGVWEREQARLSRAREQVERELEEWKERVDSSEHQFWRTFLSETAAEESHLTTERQGFFQETVQPLLTMRVRLKSYLKREKKENGEAREEEVKSVFEGVKNKSNKLLSALGKEFYQVQSEVMTATEGMEKEPVDEEDRVVPQELVDEKEGVESAIYDAALRQLQLLDNYYDHSLASLTQHSQAAISQQGGGWSSEDAERFRHIVGQYPSSLMRRRTLLIDRLMREFPLRTRAEIVSHESWFHAVAHYEIQVASVKRSRRHHKAELVRRLVAMLKEQRQLLQTLSISSAVGEEQKRRAEELYQKVCVWREEREAAHRKQEVERAREREREEEEREKEEQKMAEHKNKLKTQLKIYHSQKKRELEKEEEERERRWRERELELKEEERRGRQRVDYRQQLIKERCVREEAARERAMEAVRERQKRLEQLRKTVEVNALSDPLRILKPTKASEMRLHHMTDTELDARHPLFTLHGYRDNVVTSDPRYRVAAALRDAGLLQSGYARHVLASVPPSHQPRPDQKSSILK